MKYVHGSSTKEAVWLLKYCNVQPESGRWALWGRQTFKAVRNCSEKEVWLCYECMPCMQTTGFREIWGYSERVRGFWILLLLWKTVQSSWKFTKYLMLWNLFPQGCVSALWIINSSVLKEGMTNTQVWGQCSAENTSMSSHHWSPWELPGRGCGSAFPALIPG